MLMCIADNLPDYLRLLELARLEESIFYIANETIPTREDLLFLVSKGLCTSFELYSNYANKDIFYEQFIKEMLLDTDIRREYYREKNQNMR